MAMPTFQNILQTIAPPISSHERLQIHITHDFTNYPTLDPLIYQVFSRVMAQVEGGDLMVVQKGQEAGPRRGSSELSRPLGSWHDGPWWRSGERRSINAVKGVVEGSKLVRASAESYASEYFAPKGGVEEAAKRATETLSESNPTRDSQIFLAVQAISQLVSKDFLPRPQPLKRRVKFKRLSRTRNPKLSSQSICMTPFTALHSRQFHRLYLDSGSSGLMHQAAEKALCPRASRRSLRVEESTPENGLVNGLRKA